MDAPVPLAHATTRRPDSKRWTEGELSRTADGFQWRVTGRSLAAGEGDLVRIEAAPDHAPYGLFCVAPGHQIGFNDLKAIEVAGYINAIAGKAPEPFSFRKGLRIQTLVETIQTSSREGRWIEVK